MANVTVTLTQPNVTVSDANVSNVAVTQTESNIVVSQVASIANANIITAILSVNDTGGDGSLSYDNVSGEFTYTGPNQTEANARIAAAPTQVRAHLSNSAPVLYDASTGVISIDSAALFTGKTTDDLTEGSTNKYYSSTLFNTDLATKTTDNLTEGSTNLYFTNTNANTWFATQSTTNLAEGTNLYYTDTRFDTRLATKTTDDLTEGSTNLYFTTARANSAIDAYLPGANITLAGLTVSAGTPGTYETNLNNVIVNKNILAANTFQKFSIDKAGLGTGSGLSDAEFVVEGDANVDILSTIDTKYLLSKDYTVGDGLNDIDPFPGRNIFTVRLDRIGSFSSSSPYPNQLFQIANVTPDPHFSSGTVGNGNYTANNGMWHSNVILSGNIMLDSSKYTLVDDTNTYPGLTPGQANVAITDGKGTRLIIPAGNVGNVSYVGTSNTTPSNTSVYDMALVTGTTNTALYDDTRGITMANKSYRTDIGNAYITSRTATEVSTRWQKIFAPKLPLNNKFQKTLNFTFTDPNDSTYQSSDTTTSYNSLHIGNDGLLVLDNWSDGNYDGNAGISSAKEYLKHNRYISVSNPQGNVDYLSNMVLVVNNIGSGQGVSEAQAANVGIKAVLESDHDTSFFSVVKSANIATAHSAGTDAFKVDAGGNVTINEAFTLPNADGSADEVLKTYGNGVVRWAADTGSNVAVVQYISENALTVGGNLQVNGNIDATGNINYQNVTDLYVTDQKITLNANATTDATVEIIANRPQAGTNTLIRWNETDDKWQFTNDGSTFYNIPASTSDLAEGTNLYYTDGRVDTRFDTRLATKTTDNLTEGSTNKYFNGKNTDQLSEGSTNLYFTTARANSAIGDYTGNVTAVSTTGNITTTANISGGFILGNGSQLSGITASVGNSLTDVNNITSENNESASLITKGSSGFAELNREIDGVETVGLQADAQGYAIKSLAPWQGVTLSTTQPSNGVNLTGMVISGSGSGTATFTAGSNVVQLTGLYTEVAFNGGTLDQDLANFYANGMVIINTGIQSAGNGNQNKPITYPLSENAKTVALANSTAGGTANVIMSETSPIDYTWTGNDLWDKVIVHTLQNSGTGRTLALSSVLTANAQQTSAAMPVSRIDHFLNDTGTNSLAEFDTGSRSTFTGANVTATGFNSSFYSTTAKKFKNTTIRGTGGANKFANVVLIGNDAQYDDSGFGYNYWPSFGITTLWNGTDSPGNDTGSAIEPPITPGLRFIQFTDKTIQDPTGSSPQETSAGGPRILLNSSQGNVDVGVSDYYPRQHQGLGVFGVYGSTKTNPFPRTRSSLPGGIYFTASEDWTANTGTDAYFVSTPQGKVGTDTTANEAQMFLASANGETTLLGTNKVSFYQSANAFSGGNIVAGLQTIKGGTEWANISSTGIQTGGTIAGDNTTLKKFNETKVDLGSVSGDQSSALNATNGSIYTLTATGGITINSINNAVAGTSMTIIITQDGTGSHALTSSWKFAGGDKTLSTGGGSIDVISVFFDGTNYYASLTKAYA